ncbi:hypothetical protein [Arthrobacter polaris]|uniref:hypothetical protein n=1 Tax=Arthrobacter polaris TaxID=2813727 RepID=UPI001F38F972|nr:hypothetical protein [Arthrobacter polaris]UIK88763.1 hypothetical protein J0916_15915 [Arthrobacter polaris]
MTFCGRSTANQNGSAITAALALGFTVAAILSLAGFAAALSLAEVTLAGSAT